jgi:sulfate/thiosulfate transport system ATP-binding protein
MTVYENVTYGLRVRRSQRRRKERRPPILSLIQLEGMEERFPNQLSGGQQQRVALARALF